MKQHTTLGHVATVARSLGIRPERLVSPDATDDQLLDAKEESDMAERLNRIEDDYEDSQPRELTAEEMAAEHRRSWVTRVEVMPDVEPRRRLRETSVAARQAGRLDPTDPPGIEGNMWATTGKNSAGSDASMGPAAETSTVTCPNCRHEFTVAAVHKTAAESVRAGLFEAMGIREAASMDPETLISFQNSELKTICDWYGPMAGKKIITTTDQHEAVAAWAKMLGEHIDHLAGIEKKYTGGKDDAAIRQSAAETDYLQRRGYVGMGLPLSAAELRRLQD